MAYLKFTADRPTPNTEENRNARLAQMDLRWGSTHVYKDSKGIFWTPVIGYFSEHWGYTRGDVAHNVTRIIEIMKAEGLTFMGKAYDSDIYKSKQKITNWESILQMNHTKYLVAVNPALPIEVEEMAG